ncbi:pseudaminic acid synthase [Altererythrobacter sp. RZ02]|uniref:Pseudaminic acid synthase n=1 Tax=Pontixanthobacter rizhaonensis TaxID=2730337 RepID=A0A848QIP6_9SPHN|nr:pseudaminic acid synthase [Pontixanthobacter rizhaonensis]NMW30914.1 pseudaminic acid synthase [Pontixanthobacter rizhaonensis]
MTKAAKNSPEISIAGRRIGPDHEPYVICELSGNHNGSLERAIQLLEAAAATGADAIKIQSYTADTITIDHDGPEFRVEGGLWDGRTLYDLYGEAQTPFEWHEPLFRRARELGVTLFSSPFDETAVDLLEELGTPAYKIASFEAVDLPLVAYAASKGKPLIISTGMANLQEIEDVVQTARDNGCDEIVLLHCVSSYPALDEQSNVRTVPDLGERFGTVSGLSDHTFGSAVAVASIALGGCVVEKHFTFRRADGGPDSAFSLEPEEFTGLVEDCKRAWRSMGKATYDLQGCESGSIQFRRSLYIVKDVAAGEELTRENVRSIRPGHGLAPKHLPEVLGRKAATDLKRGDPLAWASLR